MRKAFTFIVAVVLVSATAFGWAARQTPAPAAPAPSVDEILKEFRTDMQTARADVMAKNITLSAAQAAKFWPMFEQYQKAQNAIMDEQLQAVQKYADSYNTLDDATALAFINAHLARDAKMVTLRQQWLGEFQTVLGAKMAARVIQIDRRLSLVAQTEISSRIPLVR